MNKERHMLLKLFLPVLVINVLNVAVIHAADKKETKSAQDKTMPSPPSGPYRSALGVKKETKMQFQPHMPQKNVAQNQMPQQQVMPGFNTKQWTQPTPPQWMQPKGMQPQQVPTPKWLPAPQQPAPKFNNRQWTPPAPPRWNQQQRGPVPQQAAPNFNNRQWTPPARPQWNQQQRGPVPPQFVPNYNNRQWTPPVPPQWNQGRQISPPNYVPNSQNRRW